jgi:hypothetical protein
MGTPVPSQAGNSYEVFRREDRLLQPVQVVLAQLQSHVPRLLGRPWAVGVDHDGDVVARRQPRRLDLRLLGLVQLDVAIALLDRLLGARGDLLRIAVLQQAGIGRQLVAARAAQQPMQRQAGRLAGNVPQRDVET